MRLAGLTPHELRHTAASLAVAEGANVKAVQRMLGHASAAMTLDVYADLFEDDLDQVADRLDRATWVVDSMADQGKLLVGRRYHHANPTATISGVPLTLTVLRSRARTASDDPSPSSRTASAWGQAG
ncbi:tyrosine-type recombinase/integrase [Micromonospora zamorensis]|uniref:tyrosine-type recombinase/integrase n=1 Tax=Micromonospora zamorensis TaxID=709883 RepID=UPI003CEA9DFD